MAARLGVAATCPSCAAPLDFVEGASCVRCAHCGTRLLLPGRAEVVAYHVPPRTDARRALAIARASAPGARDPALCFLPYYRFVGEELRWQWPVRPATTGVEADVDAAPGFAERALERNFLACPWDGLGLYSLGARASALRLALFRPDALPEGAHVVPPEMTATEARAHALRAADENVAHRAVVAGMLAAVYFPFWVVRLGTAQRCRFAVVDAVTGGFVSAAGPPQLLERLVDPAAVQASEVALRPLLCPNCGWELLDDPAHVIFLCGECTHAWRLDGARLVALDSVVLPRPAACMGRVRHLPMWIVETTNAPPALRRIVVPAFREQALRLALVLATQLTRRAPDLPTSGDTPAAAGGAYFDRDDALALARFVAAGIDRAAADVAELASARLVWWPFEMLPGSLREPMTGFALPAVSRESNAGDRRPAASTSAIAAARTTAR